MNFTLKQIRYFVVTAESRSINKASKTLNKSQSAITNSISELETALNVKLFGRTHAGLSLTHEGHQFLASARQILATVQDAMVNLNLVREVNEGELVLGVTSLLAGYFLSEPLMQFSRQYPRVKTLIKEDEQRFIEHLLLNGEIDVGILMTRQLQEHEAFETETLVMSPLKVWLPANHPLCAQASISVQELADEPLISLTANQIDQVISHAWRRYHKPMRPKFRTESVEAVRNLVGAGFGIAIVPDFAYRPWTLDMQRIETRPIREELPSIDFGLVWRRGSSVRWTADEFVSTTVDFVKASKPIAF
ncbi:LysR family transcriptional regulator [Shewanella sp. JM162201]|uniref:LysR family transcriptional regulator n=1 Tax=Shewanella jiangmenensis TaxID=2837387 RepID=A0ABS5V307_9GAMM|nr:LysR family transcriptional regulator [Shewanella jiangmenensis]MBT1444835.1 LysR family transcriptional regulator [Shewanella jiangmenensis]